MRPALLGPHGLLRETVDLYLTAATVEVLHNGKRVAAPTCSDRDDGARDRPPSHVVCREDAGPGPTTVADVVAIGAPSGTHRQPARHQGRDASQPGKQIAPRLASLPRCGVSNKSDGSTGRTAIINRACARYRRSPAVPWRAAAPGSSARGACADIWDTLSRSMVVADKSDRRFSARNLASAGLRQAIRRSPGSRRASS